MSCKVTEEIKVVPVIAPVAQTAGGNTTGAYLACPPELGSIDFVVRGGSLASGKALTVEVYQASDTAGTGAAEITSYETTVTAGSSGETDVLVTVSVDNADVTMGFVTVKATNTSASAYPLDAFALVRKEHCK
jgi:hypothetical protein